jgi:hypothetical protein
LGFKVVVHCLGECYYLYSYKRLSDMPKTVVNVLFNARQRLQLLWRREVGRNTLNRRHAPAVSGLQQ